MGELYKIGTFLIHSAAGFKSYINRIICTYGKIICSFRPCAPANFEIVYEIKIRF